jgi:hypothetical protein
MDDDDDDDNYCWGFRARERQFDEPVWEPLLAAVGERLTGGFMWMGELTLHNGRALHAYKHIWTRRYLHLTEDGSAFDYAPCGMYVRTRLDWAIEQALCVWWLMAGWEPEDHEAIREACLRASRASAGTINGHGD